MTAEQDWDESRRPAARRDMLRAGGWLTMSELATRRGDADGAPTGSWAFSQLRERALLVLSAPDGSLVVPAFQVTAAGDPRPELRPLLEELRGAGVDGWTAWAWLTHPSDELSREVPQEVAITDPARARRGAAAFANAAQRHRT